MFVESASFILRATVQGKGKNNLAKKILVIEPDLGLVEQVYEEFKKTGVKRNSHIINRH